MTEPLIPGPLRGQARLSTRTLLICAALAAVQTLAFLVFSPFTPALAAAMPPIYALVAGVHGVMPFLARILTQEPWSATITAAVAGMLVWPFSAVGPLVIVVFVAGAASFDVLLQRSGRPSSGRLYVAACLAGTVLFLVSLPAFSSQHLTVPFLVGTVIGRLLGETGALIVAAMIAQALRRAGFGAGTGFGSG